jgi:hypothetical protein
LRYVLLSRLLELEPATLDFGDGVVSPVPVWQTRSPYQIYLLGTARFVLVGERTVTLVIPTLRQRELLAYLALSAQERDATWSHLVSVIYEARLSEDDTSEPLQARFYNDVRDMRKVVRESCEQAGLPYLDPIELTGPGKEKRYRLAATYEVVDISHLEQLSQRLKTLIAEGEAAAAAEVNTAAREVLAGSQQSFLDRQVPERRTVAWPATTTSATR